MNKEQKIKALLSLQRNERLTGNEASILHMYDDMIIAVELDEA